MGDVAKYAVGDTEEMRCRNTETQQLHVLVRGDRMSQTWICLDCNPRLAVLADHADAVRDRDRWLRRAGELQARLDAVAEAMRPPDIGERLRGAEGPPLRSRHGWACCCASCRPGAL